MLILKLKMKNINLGLNGNIKDPLNTQTVNLIDRLRITHS